MPPAADERRLATHAGRALGSRVQLTVAVPIDCPDGVAIRAWTAVTDELAAVDAALSRFRDDSELVALNERAGTGARVPVSRRLGVLLATADRARRVTGGRFDARVVDALERIGERGATARRPAPPAARGTGPCRRLACAPDRPIDSGGLGKGLALRWAAERAMAVLPAGAGVLLDAGGDLVAAGHAPVGGWAIGIEDPAAGDPLGADPVGVVALRAGAIATSSVAARRWTAPHGRVVHHLLDPQTGEPARTGLIAVTVAHPDPAWAEVWTKALFLAGRVAIAHEARARGLAAWWIEDNGSLGMTPAARTQTVWAAEPRLGYVPSAASSSSAVG